MAGDWIKMRGNLWDDPRVAKLCDLTDQSEAAIIGALYWLWATADQHTEDGILPSLTLRAIDRKTGVQGFGNALVAIGWLEDHPDGVRIVNFEDHNGASAKRRSLDAQRKANVRSASASDADKPRTEEGQNAPTCGAREEKRREEKEDTSSPSDDASLPACPQSSLIDLYRKHLPNLPQPRKELWTGVKADSMKARWRWVLTAKRESGDRYAQTADQALTWFDEFFEHAAQSDFLTGRNGKWRGCDLAWLMKAENFAKVVQGNYVNEGAAA